MCIRDRPCNDVSGIDVVTGTSGLVTCAQATRDELGLNAPCLLYTSDAADERSSVDLGGRRIINNKKRDVHREKTWRDRRTIGDM